MHTQPSYAAYSGESCGSGTSHCQPPGYHGCPSATGGVCGTTFDCCSDSIWNKAVGTPVPGGGHQVSQSGGYVNEPCGGSSGPNPVASCQPSTSGYASCSAPNAGVCKNVSNTLWCCAKSTTTTPPPVSSNVKKALVNDPCGRGAGKDSCVNLGVYSNCPASAGGTCNNGNAQLACCAIAGRVKATNPPPVSNATGVCSSVTFGNGLYCGNNGGAKGTTGTLYNCQSGTATQTISCASHGGSCNAVTGGSACADGYNGTTANVAPVPIGSACGSGSAGKCTTKCDTSISTIDRSVTCQNGGVCCVSVPDIGYSCGVLGGSCSLTCTTGIKDTSSINQCQNSICCVSSTQGIGNPCGNAGGDCTLACDTSKGLFRKDVSGVNACQIGICCVSTIQQAVQAVISGVPFTQVLGDTTRKNVLALQIITQTDTVTYDKQTDSFSNPAFNVTNFPPNQYKFILHVDGYLDKTVSNTANSAFTISSGQTTFNVPATSLIKGDIAPQPYGDNVIDILDYSAVFGCLGMKPSNTPTATCLYPQKADINNDGIIDQTDLTIIQSKFGQKGDTFVEKTPTFSCVTDPSCNSSNNSLQICPLKCTLQ